MIHWNPQSWKGYSNFFPSLKDVRWKVAALLSLYLIFGITFFGFSRHPLQVVVVLGLGMLLDFLFRGFFQKKAVFPLSGYISSLSLAILLNYTLGFAWIWIPVFIAIASKYVFVYKKSHLFNPSLFAICVCLLFGQEFITLAPAYQWYGVVEVSWLATFFILTGAFMVFVFKINRTWLIGSFLFFFLLQSILRAVILEHVIPFSTLVYSSIWTPSFYLFTFFMITDPKTSPKGKYAQILTGFGIAALDLVYHTKFSYFTFFFAGLSVATIRFLIIFGKDIWQKEVETRAFLRSLNTVPVLALLALPLFIGFTYPHLERNTNTSEKEQFTLLHPEQTGLDFEKSDILQQVDKRLLHVAKWLLSVGDAVAFSDVDNDGDQDIFLTNAIKTPDWQAKLFINQGNFQFEKRTIPDMDKYLGNPKKYGLPSAGLFFDFDNDGDEDLFVGMGFGPSRLFENQLQQTGNLDFVEKNIPGLSDEHSVCIAANVFDMNKDGKTDLLVGNALMTHLEDYDSPTPLNIFDLPEAEYDEDRRMLRFMHESWHNANNGGVNKMYLNDGRGHFEIIPTETSNLKETRWSLAIGTADLNDDGFTDLYIANDFGRDDCYLNKGGKIFVRQQGNFYGELGLDTYKGMNVSMFDLDRDNREDIYISNVHHSLQAEGSLLWRNETVSGSDVIALDESAVTYNLYNPNRFGWGGTVGDIDLDGWTDVLQANGMVDDIWDKIYEERMDYWYFQAQIARTGPEVHSYADKWADIRGMSIYENEADRLYINQKGEYFMDKAEQLGIRHRKNTRAVGAADLDNDGDLDLLFTDQYGAPQVYRNDLKEKRWIGLDMQGNGVVTALDAIGTKVWVSYAGQDNALEQYKEVRCVNGFSSQSDKRLVFGLGDLKEGIQEVRVKVKWYGGEEEVRALGINAYYSIIQKLEN